ncbi:MAG: c-type cytochrome [Verrucomicrobiaceae bacterium]|nr:c-type cytochrome [Verrucomicrobiaceae bacterium]
MILRLRFLTCLLCLGVSSAAEPVIPALAVKDLGADIKGQILIEEMNCVACHAAEGTLSTTSKKAPRLAQIGSRVHPAYIESFVHDPHGMKPGTTMPDALARLPEAEKAVVASELTHFLLSLKKPNFTPQAPDHVAASLGHQLFQSRGCAACHAPRDERAAELPMANSVPLGALENKYSHESLVTFLRQPHASRPSGRMPDMRLQGRDVERIAHFLLQHTRVPGALRYTLYRGNVWEGMAGENVAAERGGQVADFALASLGRVEQHTAVRYEGRLLVKSKGTHTFHLTMNGGTLKVDGKALVDEAPSDRRGVKSFTAAVELDAGSHAIEFTYFHTGRKAELVFEMTAPQFPRGPIPTTMLSVTKEPLAPFATLKVNPTLAQRGREHFTQYGCANCHDDLNLPRLSAPDWTKLDASRGCLADSAGPRFGLSATQRELIVKALPTAANPHFDDTQRIHKTLAALNCIACHERSALGGPATERRALFTSTQPSLGDQGRIPPPLSYVGAKLTPQWFADVLLHAKRQRDYMDAAMPQFGEAQVGHLPELFARVDKLEDAVLPKVMQLQESKAAGYELAGTSGLGCIICHQFNGQRAGEISALDLAYTTQRLQKNWFTLFMRQPSRFHPTVIMPGFWPDGKSLRPNILAGDSAQQIEAIWNYLADGERAKKPVGISRQSNELRVGDVPEICRGRGTAGFRGIGVGYPERVNLAFDSGEMALRMLWRGEFANVDNGSFNPRGSDAISFPPGIPFHHLKSLDESWPYKGKTSYTFPQDHGYEFRGYTLDAQRRPTFRYSFGEVAVEDFFEDVHGESGRGFFKRTLRLTTSAEQPMFYFRAAAGKSADKISEREFRLEKLTLRIADGMSGIVRDGTPAEVLLPLTLPVGETKLVLEYSW